MIYLGDFPVDYATLTFFWNTNDGDGASITRATDGTVKLIRDDNTDCTAGSITDNEDSPDTGIHRCLVDLSGNVNVIAAHDYTVWVDGAVIDGATVNAALACFSVENRFDAETATEIVTALFAKTGITADGAVSFNTIVKCLYAMARGKIEKSGDVYLFKDDDDSTTLFTLTIAAAERVVS